MSTFLTGALDDLLDRTVIGSFTNFGRGTCRARVGTSTCRHWTARTSSSPGPPPGLGRAAGAERLARMGAGVRLVGRSPVKLENTRREIAEATGNDDLSAYVADFSSMEQIRTVAEALLAE